MNGKSNIAKMEKMNEEKFPHSQDTTFYINIINEYLEFIEKQCYKAVHKRLNPGALPGGDLTVENEALELSNRVMDKLKDKNCRVLRQFKGNSRLSTYITAIIANQAVDLIRKKRGRGREKERAKQFGDRGLQIYELAVVEGRSPSEIFRIIESDRGISLSQEDIEMMVDKIKGKRNSDISIEENNHTVKKGSFVDEKGEPVVPDLKSNPEETFLVKQQREKRMEIFNHIISRLNGEERLILKMRFHLDDMDGSAKIERISEVLGISKKAVYSRIGRTLKKCKDMIQQMGVNIDDLF